MIRTSSVEDLRGGRGNRRAAQPDVGLLDAVLGMHTGLVLVTDLGGRWFSPIPSRSRQRACSRPGGRSARRATGLARSRRNPGALLPREEFPSALPEATCRDNGEDGRGFEGGAHRKRAPRAARRGTAARSVACVHRDGAARCSRPDRPPGSRQLPRSRRAVPHARKVAGRQQPAAS